MGLSCLVELSELRLSGRVVLQPVKLLGALYKLRVMELTQDLQVGAVGKGGDEEEQGARARAAHGAHARYTGMPRGGGGRGSTNGVHAKNCVLNLYTWCNWCSVGTTW
jgi:hypothetical protein